MAGSRSLALVLAVLVGHAPAGFAIGEQSASLLEQESHVVIRDRAAGGRVQVQDRGTEESALEEDAEREEDQDLEREEDDERVDEEEDDHDIEEANLDDEELDELHQRIDTNGDGYASMAEVQRFTEAVLSRAFEHDLQTLLRDLDADGDGKLSLEEYLSDFHDDDDRTQLEIDNEESEVKKFYAADIDKDGYLTPEEMHAIVNPNGHKTSWVELMRAVNLTGSRDPPKGCPTMCMAIGKSGKWPHPMLDGQACECFMNTETLIFDGSILNCKHGSQWTQEDWGGGSGECKMPSSRSIASRSVLELEVADMLRHRDGDGDGEVSLAEYLDGERRLDALSDIDEEEEDGGESATFLQTAEGQREDAEIEADLKSEFQDMDTDKNGKLSFKELQQLHRIDEIRRMEDTQELFNEVDRDHDGHISREEWRHAGVDIFDSPLLEEWEDLGAFAQDAK